MAEEYWPFDAGAGANSMEDRWREMASLWLGSGTFKSELNGLAVSPPIGGDPGLSIRVASGKAWVSGHFYKNTASLLKPISPNVSGNPRIDRIILRADFVNNDVLVRVLEGVPAVTPAAPALTRDATMYEISLAQVAVADDAAAIVLANLTDERTSAYAPSGLTPIAEIILGADAASITFSNIPQTYRHLMLVCNGRSAGARIDIGIRFNGDSAGNYDYQLLQAAAGSVAASEGLAQTAGRLGTLPGSGSPNGEVDAIIAHYAAAVLQKSSRSHCIEKEGAASGQVSVRYQGAFWRNAAPITSVTVTTLGAASLQSGFIGTLYGMGVL